MFFKAIAVVMFVFLVGCAGVEENRSDQLQVDQLNNEAVVKKKAAKVEQKTAIDNDVLYMLLTAELAGQRKQYNVALEGYLRAARRVNDAIIAERAAKIALYVKDMDKADEAVNLWLKQSPDSLPARRIATLSAFRRGDNVKALEHLNVLLAKDPAGFEKALMELVGFLGKEVQPKAIYELIAELSNQHPDKAVLYFVQALLALQMEDASLSEQKILKAIELQPEWDKALIFQAQLAFYAKQDEKAERLLLDIIEKKPENKKLKNMLAQVYIRSADYERAGDVYQALLKDNNADMDARFALALVRIQQEQYKPAEDLLRQLLEQPNWESQASFYLGRLAVRTNDPEQAVAWFDKVGRGAFAFDASMGAVSVLMDKGQIDEASARLSNMRLRFPRQELRILVMQAELLNQQKKYPEAFELLSKALTDTPGQKDLLYARALVAEHLDRLDILESDLTEILKNHPDDANALNALGYTLADKTERYQDALKYLQQALKLKPNEPVIIDSYGWLQFKMGNVEQALSFLRQAYSGQQEPEIAAHLIEVLWVSGEKDEARQLFDEVVKIAPDDKHLVDIKKRIFGLQ